MAGILCGHAGPLWADGVAEPHSSWVSVRCGRHFQGHAHLQNPQILPSPIRLLLLALAIRELLLRVGLPLLARQFWSTTVLILVIAACVWLLILRERLGRALPG